MAMTDTEFKKFVQQRLADHGHYTMKIDGVIGPGTVAAFDKALPPLVLIRPEPKPEDLIPDAGDKKLVGVHGDLAKVIRAASLSGAVPFTVIEGLRSKELQAKYVASGNSKTMNSRHLTGHAVDLWPLDPKTMKPIPSGAAFARGSNEARAANARLWSDLRQVAVAVKEAAKELGVMMEHGVDWGWDAPHHQLNRKAYP